MVKVYSININQKVETDLVAFFYNYISYESRNRLERFIFYEDKLRSLYGEIMIRYLIGQLFGIENRSLRFFKNDYGKPYIAGYPIYYNISHAGRWVVCAINSQEVGIDVEEIKEVNYGIAERFFNPNEYMELMKKEVESSRIDYFYRIWTLKECYIKWTGMGLSRGLKSFQHYYDGEKLYFIDENRRIEPFFKEYFIDEGYKLSVCSEENEFENEVRRLDINKIAVDSRRISLI